jgi:adenosylcobinamide kinase/adenosylcobinamide-phosphate guanylyltransferase
MQGEKRTFIATCVPRDDEMKQRVAKHQQERGRKWQTLEVPLNLPEAVVEHGRQADVLLVDCLTLWISNLLLDNGDDEKIQKDISDLVRALDSSECSVR